MNKGQSVSNSHLRINNEKLCVQGIFWAQVILRAHQPKADHAAD